jgi:transcriptional regulator with GAF, ATPase, and Fis domain
VLSACEVEKLRANRFQLSVLKGPDKAREVTWDGLILRVGSAPDNDLVLSDETVSRNHFRIELDDRGYRLKDLNSRNGTILDSILVKEAYLPPTCRIQIGNTTLRYKSERETVDLELTTSPRLGEMLGSSAQMRHLFALIQRVAGTDATVLIEGESGTGKELTARAIHDLSPRKGHPFEVVDCSAIPESLIESELFGHLRGAFTGAVSTRKGAMESAAGGTVFLDEIGELPLAVQGKVLRLIERREVKAVGADTPRTVDVRILAATNRTLRDEVGKGTFREDLYFRLAVVKLRLPPLRERPEDIGLLAESFLDSFSRRDGKRYTLPHSTLSRLSTYEFPGNVRELRNILERSCLLSEGVELDVEVRTAPPLDTGWAEFQSLMNLPYKDAKDSLVSAFEQKYWTRLLEMADGNVSEAARRGGIHRKSLEYLLKKIKPGSNEA